MCRGFRWSWHNRKLLLIIGWGTPKKSFLTCGGVKKGEAAVLWAFAVRDLTRPLPVAIQMGIDII
ncbi:hypothetical protein A6803_24125 [Escherichia coli]|nr:hypothetical protein A6803_24125 [Escherichia coli]